MRLPRRQFLQLAVVAASSWHSTVFAQPAEKSTIGYIDSTSPAAAAPLVMALLHGLSTRGFIENRNLIIEYRWANGDYDLLPKMAADLVARRVAVIVAATLPAALAVKKATSTVPVVFALSADPVEFGLVLLSQKAAVSGV